MKEVTCFLSELKDNSAVCGCCHTKTKIHRDVQKQYCLFISVAALWCSLFLGMYGRYFIVLCCHMCRFFFFFTRVWYWLLFWYLVLLKYSTV